MATQLTTGGWTYDEFARLPSDRNRYEIIAGELHVTPAPRTPHQIAVGELLLRLGNFVDEHVLGWVLPGPVDVLFAEGDYLEPDLVFVRRERRGIISDRGIEAAPDLVVEVASPSTAKRDRGIKRERYAHFGVPEYWVVDPDTKQIEVYRPGAEIKTYAAADILVWRPSGSEQALEIAVAEVLRGLD